MHTQSATKADKKAAKRRNRNKRRRKLRQQRKSKANGAQYSNFSTKKRNIKKPKPKKSAEEISKSWQTLCLETYQRLTTWQSEAELNFWKARTEWLQNENKELKNKLNDFNNSIIEADEVGDDDDDEPNAAYLEFKAITRRHREELKLQREKQKEVKGID